LNNTVTKKSTLYQIFSKKGNKNASFLQTSANTTNLLQWVNPILFLLHQWGNDEPCRKITSKMKDKKLGEWRKKKLRGVDEEDTS